ASQGVVVTAGLVAILGNSIYSNGVAGIADGAIYYPVLGTADSGLGFTTITGSLNPSNANQSFLLAFFAHELCTTNGSGERKTIRCLPNVTPDANSNAAFIVTFRSSNLVGQVVTATTTGPDNITTEFSACRTVLPVQAPSITSLLFPKTVAAGGT